ncbi:MAG TPA: TolC family protein [bacterium]|nr:TolC family protein [bacterium]
MTECEIESETMRSGKGFMMNRRFLIPAIWIMLGFTHLSAQDSLGLPEAVGRALEYNYDIRIRRLDKRIAAIQNTWGTAGAFPSLDFSISASRRQDLDTGDRDVRDMASTNLTLQWILFDGFAVRIRKARLDQLERLSAGNTALLIEESVQAVILAYYNALLQLKQADVLDTLRTLSGNRYERAESQRQLGALVTYDLLQAKNAWLEDEARYLEQTARARNAMRDLNYLIGETDDRAYRLTEPFEAAANTYEYGILKDRMLADNRLLRNRYLRQTLLEKQVALARSEWWPSLSLRAGLEGSRIDIRPSPLTTYEGYGTLNLSWNLFSGGARNRAVQIAKVDHEIGQVETDAMIHSLSNRLAAQLELFEVRKKLVDVAAEAQATAALNLEISGEKFRTGAINSFNYRDVQMLYLNAAVGRLTAVYRLIESQTELLRLTGGILSSFPEE